jgi:hypothetical protein
MFDLLGKLIFVVIVLSMPIIIILHGNKVDISIKTEEQVQLEEETRTSRIDELRISYLTTDMSEHTQYVKDTTTGICFARQRSGPHGLALATVDCNALSNVDIIEFSSPSIQN